VDARSKEKYPADLLSYRNVNPEIRVECGDIKEGNKKHMLRVASVTAPQYVEDFFFPEAAGGKCILPTFYFDDIHEIMTWQGINLVIRDSLTNGIRLAESWEKEADVMQKLGHVSDITKTVNQLADGASGIAVIRIPKSRYSFNVGFQIVSDGITVLPGPVATERSKKASVYEEIIDGKPVVEFFARAKDGSFVNKKLQELAIRNEAFELSWLMPAAVIRHTAQYVSVDNVSSLVMLTDEGGRNGTYVFKISVKASASTVNKREETEVYREVEVAYVVTRESDTITFVEGLTRHSVDRLVEQGFALDTPYALGELRGFVLHILQKVYSKVSDTRYDEFPEHLKGARAKAAQKSTTRVVADKGEGSVPRGDEQDEQQSK
ncbi:MAG: hypothetical protein AAB972_01125, partial [Patescibacteria group bacterium]